VRLKGQPNDIVNTVAPSFDYALAVIFDKAPELPERDILIAFLRYNKPKTLDSVIAKKRYWTHAKRKA
jgi:hypothetical protein